MKWFTLSALQEEEMKTLLWVLFAALMVPGSVLYGVVKLAAVIVFWLLYSVWKVISWPVRAIIDLVKSRGPFPYEFQSPFAETNYDA